MQLAPSLILLTLGCVISTADAAAADPPPAADPAAPVEEIEEPSEEPSKLAKKVARGRSPRFEVGAPHGVWIWHSGNKWHVRTTTKSADHRFTGFVEAGKGAKLEHVGTTRTDLRDRVVLRDDRVRFDFTTRGHADGFDFKLSGQGCVRFAIRVDGDAAPQMVKLGEEAVQPASWHFRLCS